MVFKSNYRLMQVVSIAECSKWSILQYFPPSLCYQLLLRSLFCLFLSGRFTHVLLIKLSVGCAGQDQLSLNAGQKYCRMLQVEHSAILSTFIKLPTVIKIFVLSIFKWPFYTGFTVSSFQWVVHAYIVCRCDKQFFSSKSLRIK